MGAAHTLDLISTIIDDASAIRLLSWKERVRTRRGAASWVKQRCAELIDAALSPVQAVAFNANEIARGLAEDLAMRWNTGVFRIASGRLDVSAHLRPGLPCVQISQPPPARQLDPFDADLSGPCLACSRRRPGLRNLF